MVKQLNLLISTIKFIIHFFICDADICEKAGTQYAYGYLGGTSAINLAVVNNSMNTDLLYHRGMVDLWV